MATTQGTNSIDSRATSLVPYVGGMGQYTQDSTEVFTDGSGGMHSSDKGSGGAVGHGYAHKQDQIGLQSMAHEDD